MMQQIIWNLQYRIANQYAIYHNHEIIYNINQWFYIKPCFPFVYIQYKNKIYFDKSNLEMVQRVSSKITWYMNLLDLPVELGGVVGGNCVDESESDEKVFFLGVRRIFVGLQGRGLLEQDAS